MKEDMQKKLIEYAKGGTGEPFGDVSESRSNGLLEASDIVGWADGITAALGTEDLADRITDAEAELASAILAVAHKRNYSF